MARADAVYGSGRQSDRTLGFSADRVGELDAEDFCDADREKVLASIKASTFSALAIKG